MSEVICVAGPMAAGKNAACALLENRGWLCIDADKVGHAAAAAKEAEIIETFTPFAAARGIKLTGDDGHLIRRALGTLLFSDKTLLAIHENIVYPAIESAVRSIIDGADGKNVVINAAVLYKVPPLMQLCRRIIFIDAPLYLRLRRARRRDALRFALILQRFIAQKNMLSSYRKTGIPLTRIQNSSTLQKLEQKLIKAGL